MNPTEQSELKACPFCGLAQMVNKGMFTINHKPNCFLYDRMGSGFKDEQFILKWNTRTTTPTEGEKMKCKEQSELKACPLDIDKAVEAFLSWPLPASVNADTIATVSGASYRVGTNLLTATEARQMFEYVISKTWNTRTTTPIEGERPRCKEQFSTIPHTSEHVWHADIHGIPIDNCLKCGEPFEEWSKRSRLHLTKISSYTQTKPTPPTIDAIAEKWAKGCFAYDSSNQNAIVERIKSALTEHSAELQKELERYHICFPKFKSNPEGLMDYIIKKGDTLTDYKEVVPIVVSALENWGQHHYWCNSLKNKINPNNIKSIIQTIKPVLCNCGFTEALTRAKELLKKEGVC